MHQQTQSAIGCLKLEPPSVGLVACWLVSVWFSNWVLVDFLVLHASGQNTSGRSRWSMQFRYFNFCEPTGRAHGWKGSYANGVDFRTVHPELSVEA